MGARDRAEAEDRRMITGAWLMGQLGGMADPETYPALEDLLGMEPEEPEEEPSPEAAHIGARLWIMHLNSRKG